MELLTFTMNELKYTGNIIKAEKNKLKIKSYKSYYNYIGQSPNQNPRTINHVSPTKKRIVRSSSNSSKNKNRSKRVIKRSLSNSNKTSIKYNPLEI